MREGNSEKTSLPIACEATNSSVKACEAISSATRHGESPWRLACEATKFLRNPVTLFFDVRRERCLILSGSESHLARSLQPVAIGAVEEVTNPPKPSMKRVALATPRVGRPERE